MSRIAKLRKRLNLTQSGLGEVVGCTQGNVGHYERGQTIPPEVAKRLIAYARSQGVEVGYEDIYGPITSANEGALDDVARAA